MKKIIKIQILLFIILTILGHGSELVGQMRSDLKEFLWEKDFDQLIADYAEEVIVLMDEGDFQKRLKMRSFYETNGYRIQTFAGSNKENAHKMANNIVTLNLDSVYVVEEQGLYKVQIGNFTERIESEKMLDQLRFRGITNAWIVETTIHVTKQPTTSPDTSIEKKEIPPFYYAIQLFVTKDPEKAKLFSTEFSRNLGYPASIIQSGEFWKVLTGRHTQEITAREYLDEIRNSGYPDAWLTQINP